MGHESNGKLLTFFPEVVPIIESSSFSVSFIRWVILFRMCSLDDLLTPSRCPDLSRNREPLKMSRRCSGKLLCLTDGCCRIFSWSKWVICDWCLHMIFTSNSWNRNVILSQTKSHSFDSDLGTSSNVLSLSPRLLDFLEQSLCLEVCWLSASAWAFNILYPFGLCVPGISPECHLQYISHEMTYFNPRVGIDSST